MSYARHADHDDDVVCEDCPAIPQPATLHLSGWHEPEAPTDTVMRMVARDPNQNVEVTFAVDHRIGRDLIRALSDAALNGGDPIVVDPEPWQVLSIARVPWHAYRSGRKGRATND